MRARKGYALIDAVLAALIVLSTISVIVGCAYSLYLKAEQNKIKEVRNFMRSRLIALEQKCRDDPNYQKIETLTLPISGEVYVEENCFYLSDNLLKGSISVVLENGKEYFQDEEYISTM